MLDHGIILSINVILSYTIIYYSTVSYTMVCYKYGIPVYHNMDLKPVIGAFSLGALVLGFGV